MKAAAVEVVMRRQCLFAVIRHALLAAYATARHSTTRRAVLRSERDDASLHVDVDDYYFAVMLRRHD